MCAWSNPVTLQVGRLELVFPAQPQHRGQWTQPGSWRPPRVGPQAGAWSAKGRQWGRAFGPREQHVQEASRCSRGWSVGSRRAAQPGRGQRLHQRSSLQIEAQRGKRRPRGTGKFMAEPMDSPAGTCLPGCPLLPQAASSSRWPIAHPPTSSCQGSAGPFGRRSRATGPSAPALPSPRQLATAGSTPVPQVTS